MLSSLLDVFCSFQAARRLTSSLPGQTAIVCDFRADWIPAIDAGRCLDASGLFSLPEGCMHSFRRARPGKGSSSRPPRSPGRFRGITAPAESPAAASLLSSDHQVQDIIRASRLPMFKNAAKVCGKILRTSKVCLSEIQYVKIDSKDVSLHVYFLLENLF